MSAGCVISAHIPKVECMGVNNTSKKTKSIINGFVNQENDDLPEFGTRTLEKRISKSNNLGPNYNGLSFDVDAQVRYVRRKIVILPNVLSFHFYDNSTSAN